MAKRKTIFELEAKLKALRVPTLILAGDQDAPCVEPSLVMRAWIPHAGLILFPASGHTPNLEEPVIATAQDGSLAATLSFVPTRMRAILCSGIELQSRPGMVFDLS